MLVLMLCIRPIIGVDETRYYGARHFVTFDENVHVGIEGSRGVLHSGVVCGVASAYCTVHEVRMLWECIRNFYRGWVNR